MLIREFISETNKNQMISRLLKHYKVGSVKLKYKSMKDFAHFDVDRGELQLSTRYKSVKKRDVEDFLTTIIHEIYHAMDAKRYGWRKFKEMYLPITEEEYRQNLQEIEEIEKELEKRKK